ncbi:MAG TPA: GNAT family N-acetyltransferase [Solirubrobacteraceae bacterium]
MTISLRPVGPDDQSFLRRVYASTREAELANVDWTDEQKAEFVRFQFHAQATHYRERFPDAAHHVILVDGRQAGRLYVDRRPDEICVVDIALLPEFRGRGVGGSLLRDVLAEAERSGCPVTIHVERFNPAQRLYARLGFVLAEEEGPVYLMMRWTPGGSGIRCEMERF